MIDVVTLYTFCAIERHYRIKAKLLDWVGDRDIKGTLIIAPEGVNGTLSGTRDELNALIDTLRGLLNVPPFDLKWSTASEHPFGKLKFPLKNEVITMGEVQPDPTKRVGQYVSASEWNALLDREDLILVDTRNDYEVALGSFEGAVNPKTTAFREFDDWSKTHLEDCKERPVAMFCTGGIRCEKATSLLLERGFTEVYHLKGGILRYLEDVDEGKSKWQGECFVFDDRVSLKHGLALGSASMCRQCGRPIAGGRIANEKAKCLNCRQAGE